MMNKPLKQVHYYNQEIQSVVEFCSSGTKSSLGCYRRLLWEDKI